MSDEATRILDAALKLPDAERAELAAILADSVRHGTDLSLNEFDAAWSAEAARRGAAIDCGEQGTVDYDELMHRLRAKTRGRSADELDEAKVPRVSTG